MKRAFLLTLTVVLTMSSSQAVTYVAVRQAKPVTAAGKITFSGSRPGQIRSLSIPRKVWLSPVRSPYNSTISVNLGGARFAAVAILGVTDPGFWVVIGREPKPNSCTTEDAVTEAIPTPLAECPEGDPLLIETSRPTFDDPLVFPKGMYRVVYLPVGGRPTITLRMPQLRGAIKPALSAGVSVTAKTVRGAATHRTVFQGGASHDFRSARSGMILTMLTSVVTGPNAAQAGYCAYPNASGTLFHPACGPLARSGAGTSAGNTSALRERDHRYALIRNVRGPWSVGWWYATSGYIHKIAATTVWIVYPT